MSDLLLLLCLIIILYKIINIPIRFGIFDIQSPSIKMCMLQRIVSSFCFLDWKKFDKCKTSVLVVHFYRKANCSNVTEPFENFSDILFGGFKGYISNHQLWRSLDWFIFLLSLWECMLPSVLWKWKLKTVIIQ